ncbi:hypothetical protein AB0P37_11685 [Streptomyces antimycoticus]|uniref:hypothetical protein n=1 Tax=Streptomyces antimycoticus TaxID=68175 RepID=UPI00344A74BA
MSTPASEPTARFRKSRTRSRNINPSPPLRVSNLNPHQYDLRPACASLICPECKTSVPITGVRAKIQKLVPHDTGTVHKDASIRCKNSNRRVTVDVAYEVWQRLLEQGGVEAAGCHSARQHYKPILAPAKPVTKITPAPVNAPDALTAYREHLKKCRASSAAGRCGGTHRCADGAGLAALYEQLRRTQSHRDREHTEEARVNALLTRHRAARSRAANSDEWAKQQEATTNAKTVTAKRSGTLIEEANNTCRTRLADTVRERGPLLPLKTLRVGV